ncbi:vanin-like protein 2 isoform X2 [Onthophagus taurus]
MEYGLKNDPGLSDFENVLTNTRECVFQIGQAKNESNANIIVFPEYVLTTPNLPNNLENISTYVPTPAEDASPCMRVRSPYADFLVLISCAAFQHQVYVVINVIEKANSSTNSIIYYNTNVVFDTRGAVIARYRKINLVNEDMFTPGEEVTVFTSFGVTFGLLSTADILHKNPLETLMNDLRVTDLIYPNSWHSETPFFKGLSLQDGVAKKYGVNLLASGYSDPRDGMGGSGIFLSDASIGIIDLSLITTQTRLASRVNIIPTRTPASVCEHNVNVIPRIGGQPPTVDNFGLNFENMELYTFVDLELGVNVTTGEVCSEGSDFCCEYDIAFNSPLTNTSTVYKVAAFYGIRSMSNPLSTLGVRSCALVACQNDNSSSCSMRPSAFNVEFSRVTIKTHVPTNQDTFYIPSTLSSSLRPLTLYTYCEGDIEDGQVEIAMTIERANDIMAFGIFGRVYNLDGGEVGRGFGSFIKALTMLIFSSIVAAYLM